MNLDRERLRARILKRVTVDPDSGCWLWPASSCNSGGYGQIQVGGRKGKQIGAHVAAYIAWIGDVPDDHVVDHRTCDEPSCCNPAHLIACKQSENLNRSEHTVNGVNARKQHCPTCGGPYDLRKGRKPDQLVRICRPCRNARDRAARARK